KMISVSNLDSPSDRRRVEAMLRQLRLDPADLALHRGDFSEKADAVQKILADVASRGDEALVELSRKFDDPNFSADQIRVSEQEMAEAAKRVPADQISALRRSIAQVSEYQTHILPKDPTPLKRAGV